MNQLIFKLSGKRIVNTNIRKVIGSNDVLSFNNFKHWLTHLNFVILPATSFLRDFDLMKRNAINFNGKDSKLGSDATDIYEFVKTTIEQNRDEFDQMEEAVEDQINGRKKKKLKSAAKGKISASKAPVMNTANIVVDGVETQVNLGTNLPFGFGGDDSDSDDS